MNYKSLTTTTFVVLLIGTVVIQSQSSTCSKCKEKYGYEWHFENLRQINNNHAKSNISSLVKNSNTWLRLYVYRCDEIDFEHLGSILSSKTSYVVCGQFHSKISTNENNNKNNNNKPSTSICTLTIDEVSGPLTCSESCSPKRYWALTVSSTSPLFYCICMSCKDDHQDLVPEERSRFSRSIENINIENTSVATRQPPNNHNISLVVNHSSQLKTHILTTMIPVTVPLDFNCTLRNCTSKNMGKQLTYVKIMAPLSILALLLNCVLMGKLCVHKKYVLVDIFATNLTLFNIVLSIYGLGMSLFIVLPHMFDMTDMQRNKYCQGFTSMKLFSLGSIVYSLILLTLHHKIRDAASDSRDAIFRGIVWILEATLFSGLFSVTCYIKLDHWDELCGIITPHTTVETMFIAYESFYYLVTTLLVVYNVYMLCRKRRVNIRRNRARRRKCKNDIDIDIFAMTLLSLLVWVPAYIVTYPFSGIGFYNATVIRVCALMTPCIIQPCIYISNNHPFFKKRRARDIGSRKRVNNTVPKDDDMLVEKDETAT